MVPLLVIPFLYVLSSLSAGKRWIFTTLFSVAFLQSVMMMGSSEPVQHFSASWFHAGDLDFRISLEWNPLTMLLVTFATLVAALVAIHSVWYFQDDRSQTRFRATLGFFMLSMYGLLVSSNLLVTFFCWELVGLSSYLLIGYYRDTAEAGPAATKAMVMNKIGDAGFLVALMAIASQTVNLDAENLMQIAGRFDEGAALIAGTGLLLAVMAKSAQLPLHTWLPDAMAGPSPVSALIHSATMVAAGVFLLVRWDFLFPGSIRSIAGITGMLTMLIGGWNALSQTGLKRLLAWSTISQLGLMVMAAGFGNGSAAILHLITHGFFKAGLFLLAGMLLMTRAHGTNDHAQHELASLGKGSLMGRTLSVALLLLAMGSAGLPLSASFISKEGIVSGLPDHAVVAFFAGTLLTLLYTGRLIWYLQPFRKGEPNHPAIALVPVVVFAVLSLWFSVAASPIGSVTWTGMALPHSTMLAMISTSWVVLIATALWFLRNSGIFIRMEQLAAPIDLDPLYHHAVLTPVLWMSNSCRWMDREVIDRLIHGLGYGTVIVARLSGWIDRQVVDGVITLVAGSMRGTGALLRRTAGGDIRGYLWWAAAGLVVLLTCLP